MHSLQFWGEAFVRAVSGQTMALILDGNSDIGGREGINIYYLICIKYLIRSREVKNQKMDDRAFQTNSVG